MHKLTNFLKKRNKLALMVTSISILVLLLISPVTASVNSWEYSPQEPVCGDTISIKGNASPEEKVDVFVTFEKTVPVSSGKFEYIIEDVKIPGGLNNLFKVEATGAKNLNVRVKVVVWVTKSSEASGDTVTVSQSSVPPGTYKIKIDGDAREGVSEVNLKITAFQGIEADSNGDFSYSYNTKAVPSGDFEIKLGDILKKVTIQSEIDSDSNSHSDSNSNSDSSSTSSSSKKTKFSPSAENKSSLLPETEPSPEPITSETQENKNTSEVLTPDKNLEARKTQVPASEKSIQKHKFLGSSVDKFYLLTGMGAGVLILIVYSRRK